MIKRHLSNGNVAHLFERSSDEAAQCGKNIFYSLGRWIEGDGGRPDCRACINRIEFNTIGVVRKAP